MNNKKILIIFIFVIIAVYVIGVAIAGKNFDNEAKNMGSFTFDRTGSYDDKYYAVSDKKEGNDNITVSIYESENNALVFTFETVRASDFWGICYSYENNQWKRNEHAKRPEDIISKYDE